jgi:hypothetical protein
MHRSIRIETRVLMEVLGLVELPLSQSETQYLEEFLRGSPGRQQSDHMFPLCCRPVAALFPLTAVEGNRADTKAATEWKHVSIYKSPIFNEIKDYDEQKTISIVSGSL